MWCTIWDGAPDQRRAQHRLCRMRIEDAARYANQRIAFGKPIGHNRWSRKNWRWWRLRSTTCATCVESGMASRSASVTAHQRGAAKLYCARTAMEVIDDAIQIMAVWAIPMRRASPASGVMSVGTYRRRYRRNYDLSSRSADPKDYQNK